MIFMHFQNSADPNITHGALLLATAKKCFTLVLLVKSKLPIATSSGNEKRNVKTSLLNGEFSEYSLRASLSGESQLDACRIK